MGKGLSVSMKGSAEKDPYHSVSVETEKYPAIQGLPNWCFLAKNAGPGWWFLPRQYSY